MLALPPKLDDDDASSLVELSHRQFGVATRADLADLGISKHFLSAQLDARRWRELGPTVVALHNGPLSLQQQWSAAVLSAEGPACLAARTAAQAGGLHGWEVEPVHILVQRGAKVNEVPEIPIKVHESRRFSAENIHPARMPPQVRIERALVDAAAWSASTRTACGLLAAGVQQRKTTASRLAEELELAGRVRHSRLMRAVLDDIEGGAHAMSELDFLKFCRRHNLPRPRLQLRFDARGRRRYLDATFTRADGRLVGVEIDGAIHLVVRTYWDDMSRQNDFVIHDRLMLRFPSAYVHADDPVMLQQLREVLHLPTCQNVGRL